MLKELDNNQINHLFRHHTKYYGGCIPSRRLKISDTKKRKFYILNLDHPNGAGTHWTSLYNCDPKTVYYIDPFGMPPPEHVIKFMKATGKKRFYSDVDLQNIDSSSCGWFCCYIMLEMLKGRQLIDIIHHDFTMDTKVNERLLEKYFKSI